ncbi:MAG: hypothetical protein FD136_2012, partial [Chitinophagaceae bacterium]
IFRIITTTHPTLKTRGYEIFKNGEHLFLHFSGSGLLYELQKSQDSLLVFKRIDDTEDFNYNIEAFVFTQKNNIYNMGGYGFWKSTGTLRKYNIKDKEWDADPIKEEIHIPFNKELCWFNPNTEHLFIPYQQIINSGIKENSDQGTFDKHVYQFDLASKTWEKLGNTDEEFLTTISKAEFKLPTSNGHLVCYNGKVYHINYEENTILEYSNPSFAQTMQRINDFHLKYYLNGTIYYLNGQTWHYDSLKVPIAKFEKTSIKVWHKKNRFLFFGIIPIVLLAAAGARKRSDKNSTKNQLETNTYKDSSDMNPTGINAKIRFNETEKQLLKLMLERTKKSNTTTIAEINYVLGIKDKNIGLQKKVRSDIMNSINEKFSFLNEVNTQLIGNIRSASDKRFFEYFIEHSNITLLELMLEESDV